MRILGIDYGDARIGLALSDASATLCGRAWTLTEWNLDRAVDAIADVVRTEGVERIVLGLPKNMDGTEGERAAKSRKLAKTVELWSGLPVRMWDERQTTCAAADLLDESGTYGSRRKEILDSVSSTVILEDYLAWRKEHPGEI